MENASVQERRLKAALDGSFFDREKPAPTSSWASEGFEDKMILKQKRIPVEKLQQMLNMELYGFNVLVEPNISAQTTATGLQIMMPSHQKNRPSVFDTALFVQRVIMVGKEVPKDLVQPGDFIYHNLQQVPRQRYNGVIVEEIRSSNIVGKVKDLELQDTFKWWLNGKLDGTYESEKERDAVRHDYGDTVFVIETKTKYVWTQGRERAKSDKQKGDHWEPVSRVGK